MTQQEVTKLGLAAESLAGQIAEIRGNYATPELIPTDKLNTLIALDDALNATQAKYAEAQRELQGKIRSGLTRSGGPLALSVEQNRLLQPGARDNFSSVDAYGFDDHQRNRRGRLQNVADTREGAHLAEYVGALAVATSPNVTKGSEIDITATRVLREKHGIENIADQRSNNINGVQQRDLTSAVESYGGILTPTVLEAAIFVLQEQYGIIPNHANVIPMSASKIKWPKRFQGPTMTFTPETLESDFTSKLQFNSFELNAIDGYIFVSYPNQLAQDSLVPLGDYVLGQIAWGTSFTWDNIALNGVGDKASGNVNGLITEVQKNLLNGSPYPGLTTATSGSATDWTKITPQDFANTKAKMRLYTPDTKNWKWFCTWSFYNIAMLPLQSSANFGWQATFADGVINSSFRPTFQGHEVVIVPGPLMPTDASGAAVVCLFGQMDLAVAYGIRLGLEVLTSQVAGLAFLTNQTYTRGIQRGAVTVHSILDNVDPTGAFIAGGIVAMKTAA